MPTPVYPVIPPPPQNGSTAALFNYAHPIGPVNPATGVAPTFASQAPQLAAPVPVPQGTPIVSTSALAQQSVNNQMHAMTSAGPAPTPAQTAAAQATLPTQQQISPTTNARGMTVAQMVVAGNAPTPTAAPAAGATPAPAGASASGAAPTDPAVAAQAAADAAQKIKDDQTASGQADFQAKIDSITNGTFALTPDQQNQINDLKAQNDILVRNIQLANQNYQSAVGIAGFRSGLAEGAMQINQGNIAAAIAYGAQQVSDQNAKLATAINDAKTAFAANDLKALDASYAVFKDTVAERQASIDRTYNKTQDAIKNAQAAVKATQDAALQAAQIREIQNKPLTDLNKDALDFVQSQFTKYPDAGILPTDTFATMTTKIMASDSYKNEQAKIVAAAQSSSSGAAPLVRAGTPDANGFVSQLYSTDGGISWHTGTSDESSNFLAAHPIGSDSASQAADNAIKNVTIGKDPTGQTKRDLQESWAAGNPQQFVNNMKAAARDGMEATSLQNLESNEKAIIELTQVKQNIHDYVAKNGDMNIFRSTGNYAEQEIGKIHDLELKRLAVSMQAYVQKYRKDITGAAYSATEAKEYEGLFPTSKDSTALADAKLDGVVDAKKLEVDAAYGNRLGKENYAQLQVMQTKTSTVTQDDFKSMAAQVGEAAAKKWVDDHNALVINVPKVSGGATAAQNIGSPQEVTQKLTSISTTKPWGEGTRATNVGQCGALVGDITSIKMGDSLSSKIAVTDPHITSDKVTVGDVFVQSVENDPQGHGHTGIINSVGSDAKGRFAIVTEANYHLNGLTTHDRKIYLNDPHLKGFAKPKSLNVA